MVEIRSHDMNDVVNKRNRNARPHWNSRMIDEKIRFKKYLISTRLEVKFFDLHGNSK